MTFRPESIHERLRKLREVLAQLESLRSVSREDFVADYRHYWLAERGLQLAAEALFDIGNHLLAGCFHVSAATYEDIPRRLEEHGVLGSELRQRLRGLGGFRNLLVHDYLQLDRNQLYGFLLNDLGSLADYADAIESFLDRHAQG
ncbi:MAG: DUF86 domain-containing protein [Acidobacteriota bacterium]